MNRPLKLAAAVAAVLVLLYAAAGFLLLPAVVRAQAVDRLKQTYGLDLAIGRIGFNPFTFTAQLERVSLSAPGGDRLLAFDAFRADFELRSLLEHALVFRAVALERPYVHVHLRADGSLNLAQAFAHAPAPKAGPEEPSTPPAVLIGEFTLSGGDVQFTDNSGGRAFDQHFTPLDLHVQHLSTRPEDRSDLVGLTLGVGDRGRLTVAGDLSAIPTRFDVRLTGQDIPLALFQPYFAGRLPAEISDGALSFDLTLGHGQPGQTAKLAVAGRTAVTRLVVKLPQRDDVVLAWDEVSATDIALDLAPDRLTVGEIAVQGLDTSFKIYADGRTNVGEVLRQATAAPVPEGAAATSGAPAPGETAAPDFPYAIGRVAVADSRLLFSDEQIRPHVRVQIDGLAGELRDLASDPAMRTVIALHGRVGEHGKADIDGAARLAAPKQDLAAKVTFGNVELTSFSPYAGKFAGYTIDKGKLFLDLRYSLVKGRITGENHAVFDQFELGDRVDSPDATRLPVKFALSLLRDRDGRIDLSLPVEGDVDSPGFRFGPLIVKALVNLLTRIVTAPFDFIGGLFGGGPEMEYAVFEAGDTDLPAAEHDKILPLAKALAERPQLLLEIQGWADPAADGAVLRQRKLDALLAAAAPTPENRATTAALAATYDGFFGAGAAAAVQAELTVAPAAAAGGQGETTAAAPAAVDPAAYEEALRARLLAAQPVSEEELGALAYARGQQVMDALVRDGGVAAERVFVRRGEIAQEGEGARAKLILDAR